MSTVWFTADTHFSHDNIIKYCSRPFKNVKEMNTKIIENWNSVVGEHDTVYHLGDFVFTKFETEIQMLTKHLKGHIHLMLGNHDHLLRHHKHLWNYFASVSDSYKEIKYAKQSMTLCHYALRVWNKSHYGAWNLYGHSHGTLEGLKNQMDVGVDCNNFTPISFDQIREKLK